MQKLTNVLKTAPSPANITKIAAITRNGPKGIYSSSLFLIFLNIKINIDIPAAIKKLNILISAVAIHPKYNPNSSHKFYIT